MKCWFSVKTDPPAEGKAVLVLFKNGEEDTSFWTAEIAYYSDGGFYQLKPDNTLGVLRKIYVTEPVEYWAKYIIPDWNEVKMLHMPLCGWKR